MLETLVRHLDMIRLTVPAFALILAAGCVGTIESGKGGSNTDASGLSSAEQTAITDFTTMALPNLQVCLGCHSGQTPNENFLAGATPAAQRATLLAFDPQVVNTDAPQSSRILNKGVHNGPALQATAASAILTWIEAERDAIGTGSGSANTLIETAQFQILTCTGAPGSDTCPTNHVALDLLGAPGATLDFVAQALGTGLYVNELTLTGGSGAGVYIEHPLFVSYPATGPEVPDSLDRFFDVKQDQAATTAGLIDGGTAAFMGFSATDPMTIIFKVVTPYVAAGSGSGSAATTGCKQLASFKTNAQLPLKTNCSSCHGGQNSQATSSMDLTNIGAADDPTILLACDQVVTRINLTDVDNSGFFVEPNPSNTTNHPFKFPTPATFTTFHDAVAIWANAEKTSP